MKIEKLTENKIRIILNSDELRLHNINVHNLMTKAMQTQNIFSDILKIAKKEVNFDTDGCKLLIETFSSSEDIFVLTITKYLPNNDCEKKKLTVKRKSFNKGCSYAVCRFDDFNAFCDFCKVFKNLHKVKTNQLAKNISLYLWKNAYYLVLRDINTNYENKNLFYSTLSEFGKLIPVSNSFESKLLEHGKVLIKKNAIDKGILYFSN